MSEQKSFAFKLGDNVKLASNENGTVIGRAEFGEQANSYQVRYTAADGRQVEAWWNEPALSAA